MISDKKLLLKAFAVSSPWNHSCATIMYAETASKARYRAGREFHGLEGKDWLGIKVHRRARFDLFEPVLHRALVHLSAKQIDILAHAAGLYQMGGIWYGHIYRSHYATEANDPDLLALVKLGLMSGPHKKFGQPYFILTKLGKTAIASLLPQTREEIVHAEHH